MIEKNISYREVALGLFMLKFCSYTAYACNLPKLISSAEKTNTCKKIMRFNIYKQTVLKYFAKIADK